MRVSSLSDKRVLRLVSRYFVPAWLSRDHYQLGPAPEAERREMERIDRDRQKRGLVGGNVCVFVVAADGAVLATLPVPRASNPDNLVPVLEQVVEGQHLRPRDPAAARASAAPPRPPIRARAEG